jgi:hypothetical protein
MAALMSSATTPALVSKRKNPVSSVTFLAPLPDALRQLVLRVGRDVLPTGIAVPVLDPGLGALEVICQRLVVEPDLRRRLLVVA